MSKRLQVVMSDKDIKLLNAEARRRKVSVSSLVRAGVIEFLSKSRPKGIEDRVASIMRFAKYNGPTGDIEQILSEIEQGRE